jgi:hypothetical protein
MWRDDTLLFELPIGLPGALRPRTFVREICGLSEDETLLVPITRTALWADLHGRRACPFDAI